MLMTVLAYASKQRSVRDSVSDDEWQRRVGLAALYRILDLYEMTDLIYNHITARVPGEPGHILLNPYGLLYGEVTASSLYKIDLDGNVILKPDSDYGLNDAAYVIHSAVHSARHDLECVIHTHTKAAVAVSAMQCGLLPISQQALTFNGCLSYHDYEGPAFDLGERERLAHNLGNNNTMILRNHGALAGGRSLIEAFLNMYLLESACSIQVAAMAGGNALTMASNEAISRTREIVKSTRGSGNSLEWNALLRKVEKADPSYKD